MHSLVVGIVGYIFLKITLSNRHSCSLFYCFLGFLAQLVQEQPYDICVKCGSWAAAEVIQQSGCIFKTTEKFDHEKIALS